MDGIVRNDPCHFFDHDSLSLFTEMGTLLRKMLKTSAETEESEAAKELLIERLALVRNLISQRARVVTETQAFVVSRSSLYSNARRRTSIICEDGSNRNALLFLQLVEHLAIRSIALQESWMKVEEPSAAKATNLNSDAKSRNRVSRGGLSKKTNFSAVV
jgi:hypothetical protein